MKNRGIIWEEVEQFLEKLGGTKQRQRGQTKRRDDQEKHRGWCFGRRNRSKDKEKTEKQMKKKQKKRRKKKETCVSARGRRRIAAAATSHPHLHHSNSIESHRPRQRHHRQVNPSPPPSFFSSLLYDLHCSAKWTVESELIHSSLFTGSDNTNPDQNALGWIRPSPKKIQEISKKLSKKFVISRIFFFINFA